MSSNAEIFARPGEIAAHFILSLFEKSPMHMEEPFYQLFVYVLALFFWVQIARFIWLMIKRVTGFERRR